MPSLIALDLGAHAIKATVLRRSGRRYDVEARYQQPVPQDGASMPGREAVFAALDSLLEEHREWRAPGNEIAVAWPGERATLHRLELPFTDRAQVEKTLPFALEGEVPFDLDDVVLAWRSKVEAGKTRALVALVPRDEFRASLDALSSRGLDPRFVFVDADTLGAWSRGPEAVAVIDVGHAHTLVSIVRSGVVESARAVNVGGRDFTRAVQIAHECSWEDAEQIKHGRVGDGLSARARRLVDDAMGVLLAEVRSTLINAEDALGVEVERVKLTGGGARMHPLADYLRQDLGVPVEPIVDDEGFPVPGEHAVADALSARFAGRTSGSEIDLRVAEHAFRGGTDVLRAAATLMAAGVSFLTFTSIAVYAYNAWALSSEEARLDEQMREVVAGVLPEVDAETLSYTTAEAMMQERTRDAQARAAVMGARAEPPTVAELLRVTQAFPPPTEVTVDVSELVLTPTSIGITAETDGYASASAVEEAIKRMPRFSGAAKSNERKVSSKVSFSISIPLGADAAEGEPPVDGEEG